MRICVLLALLAAGVEGERPGAEPHGDDLAGLEQQLELTPEDPVLLELRGLEFLEGGDRDRATWLLLDSMRHAGGDAAHQRRLAARLEELGYPHRRYEDLLEGHGRDLFQLSKSCSSRKRYATAVDLLHRCVGTPLEDEAQERLESLYDRSKTVEALLASGVDVPLQAGSRYSAEEIASEEGSHTTWADAFVVEGPSYRVRSNMGLEVAEAVAASMEQINAFYRRFYDYRTRGQSMRTCEVRVYANRSDFDEHEPSAKPTQAGFYSPGDNFVATYDPREDASPRALSALWGTLFHEASHQFTRALWPNFIPTWLNEGTACYFEGARIERGGRVSFNGIPHSRLRSLVHYFDEGEPTLEDVITYSGEGSYEGSYYPFGWGLVYFLRNFEDESFTRVYEPHFEAYMEAYKSGEKHDVMERFVEHFVEAPGREGVEDFGDLEALWMAWIRELHRLEFGGPEVADELLARARAQLAAGKASAAADTFRWALRKRPGDLIATNELARLLASEGQEDAALHTYLELAGLASEAARPEEVDADPHPFAPAPVDWCELARSGLEEVDPRFAAKLVDLEEETVSEAIALIETCEEAGLPRAALTIAEEVRSLVTDDSRLAIIHEDLRSRTDIRRWHRLAPTPGLAGWSGGGAFTFDDGAIRFEASGLSFLTLPIEEADDYRLEALFEVEEQGAIPCIGLTFGQTTTRDPKTLVGRLRSGSLSINEFLDGDREDVHTFKAQLGSKGASYRLAVEVRGGVVSAFIDGRHAGSYETDLPTLRGRPGLLVQQVSGTISSIRLLE